MFPPLKHNGGYISYGRIRTLKSFVEEDIGFKFDLRKCRRTFGQRAINEGQSIHDVSLVMGHSTMATTQKDYCEKTSMMRPVVCRDIGMRRRHLSELIAPESSIGSGAISLDMERQGTQNPKTIEFFEKIWMNKWRA